MYLVYLPIDLIARETHRGLSFNMIREEGWLELAEVLPRQTSIDSSFNDPSFQNMIRREDTALHIFHPGTGGGDTPLASVVMQASILPPELIAKHGSDGSTSSDMDVDQLSLGILLHLHPVLFFFLHHASRIPNTMEKEIETQNDKNDIELPLPTISPESSNNSNVNIPVDIGPLPMLEFQSIREMAEQERIQNNQESDWKCRPVKVGKLRQGSEMFLSCVYIENDETLLSEANNDGTKNPNRKHQIPFDQVIGIALEGRIVKAGAVLLLSTMYGYVIASVTKIIDSQKPSTEKINSNNSQSSGKTYRLSDDVLGDYQCHFDTPTLSRENSQNADNEEMVWEKDIPGYEAPLQEIIDIFAHHGDAAGPSGVVLAGCAGVGKSRLASCVAGHFSQDSIHKDKSQAASCSRNPKIFFSSVQDFLFQASVESNLLENVIVPKLKGCELWVIDDLNLLEIDAGNGDEIRNNAEITMVQNALIEAMDRFHLKCCILGIAQSDGNLPSMLTKSGRLEKSIQMFPPTQLQRTKIWKYILARDDSSRPLLNDSRSENGDWVLTLASSTAGCVPSDLMRIYRYAQQKLSAKMSRSRDSSSVLAWEDLRDAIKSTTPSQLSELDVIRPTIFAEGVSWKEIHLRSWQNFGGYPLLKQSVYRQVVVPWRIFLQGMDESKGDVTIEKEKSWLEPPPGVLFHGISGTGKSAAAKCLAVSLGLPIIQVRATDLLDKWLGGSESLLRSLFARARTVSPCVLFLDEIDAIACNREEDDGNDVSSRILSTLLNEMDGVSSAIRTNRVLVIACTNRIQSIDSALIRPGRLQEHFHMDSPDVSSLEEILKLRMGIIPMALDVSLATLASQLFDIKATGADVEGLCREATFVAMRRLEQHVDDINVEVSQQDFETAISERFGTSQRIKY